jgi:hypothetical protein
MEYGLNLLVEIIQIAIGAVVCLCLFPFIKRWYNFLIGGFIASLIVAGFSYFVISGMTRGDIGMGVSDFLIKSLLETLSSTLFGALLVSSLRTKFSRK